MSQYETLPDELPAPENDGACEHLTGLRLPDIALNSTSGRQMNLTEPGQTCVLYFYPMTGRPGVALPDDWNTIPGARGCTPQSCYNHKWQPC